VRPPQPKGVAELGYANSVKWEESQGADRYRRGLYIHFQRTTPYPQLMNFDMPDAILSCTRRQRSSTPLQALNLLNDPVYFEAAKALAVRVLQNGAPTWRERLDYAFRLCLGRPVTAREADSMAGMFAQQRALLATRPDEARALFPNWLDGIETLDGALWTAAARVLLNTDEFLHRE
jgi:hypothetical protein